MKLKTLHVDFNDSTLGTIAREGEHNRTQLVFALDEGLRDCDFINVEFGVAGSGDKLVLENLCPEEGESTLSVSLTQDVTVSGALAIQLIGYVVDSETAEPQIIAKSPVVSGVVTPSINGIKKIVQGSAELLDRILAKVNDVAQKAHTHRNYKTLDLFSCQAVETGFAQDASSEDLKWRGRIVAFDDGNTATISGVKEVEKNGQLFLRLSLSQGNVVYKKLPDYIDIPISESNDVSEELAPGLTLNGSELDFGLSNVDKVLLENFSEAADGSLLYKGETIGSGGIPSVEALPETAAEGDVVYYCPPPNTLTAADSGHKVYFNIDQIIQHLTENAGSLIEEYHEWELTSASGNVWMLTARVNNSSLQFKFEAIPSGTGSVDFLVSKWFMPSETQRGIGTGYINFHNAASVNLAGPCRYLVLPKFTEFRKYTLTSGLNVFSTDARFYRFTNGKWVEIHTNKRYLPNTEDSSPYLLEPFNSEYPFGILPNILYRFGEVDALSLSLLEGEADTVNEYRFSFISGETATALTLPDTVKWANGKVLEIQPNASYTVTIINDVASFETTADIDETDEVWDAIKDLQTELTGVNATADEILETIGGEE